MVIACTFLSAWKGPIIGDKRFGQTSEDQNWYFCPARSIPNEYQAQNRSCQIVLEACAVLRGIAFVRSREKWLGEWSATGKRVSELREGQGGCHESYDKSWPAWAVCKSRQSIDPCPVTRSYGCFYTPDQKIGFGFFPLESLRNDPWTRNWIKIILYTQPLRSRLSRRSCGTTTIAVIDVRRWLYDSFYERGRKLTGVPSLFVGRDCVNWGIKGNKYLV